MNTVRRVIPPPLPPSADPDRKRRLVAFAVAAVSDIASLGDWMFPPAQLAVDVLTAMVLWSLMGWRWPMLPALIAEAIPGLGLFPTWTLVAGAYLVYPGGAGGAGRAGSAGQQHEQGQLYTVEEGVGQDGNQQAARPEIGQAEKHREDEHTGLDRPRLMDQRKGQ